jgi:hypothetical protein
MLPQHSDRLNWYPLTGVNANAITASRIITIVPFMACILLSQLARFKLLKMTIKSAKTSIFLGQQEDNGGQAGRY